MDLRERLGRLSPEPLVRAYCLNDTTAPLLLWYRPYRNRVVSIIQEYLHIVYAHVPEVRTVCVCVAHTHTPRVCVALLSHPPVQPCDPGGASVP